VLEEGRAHLGTVAARVLERVIVRARREPSHRWNAWRELLRALLSKNNLGWLTPALACIQVSGNPDRGKTEGPPELCSGCLVLHSLATLDRVSLSNFCRRELVWRVVLFVNRRQIGGKIGQNIRMLPGIPGRAPCVACTGPVATTHDPKSNPFQRGDGVFGNWMTSARCTVFDGTSTRDTFHLVLPDRTASTLEMTAHPPSCSCSHLARTLSRLETSKILTVPYPQKCSDSVLTAVLTAFRRQFNS